MQPQQLKICTPSELEQIVKLHLSTLKESTLNQLGKKFLAIVYKTIIADSQSIFLVLRNEGKIIGFLAATQNSAYFYKNIVRQNFLQLTLEVTRQTLKNPSLFFKIINWLLFKKNHPEYPAELQFIAVSEKYQGQGLGTKLIKALNSHFKGKNVSHYKVGTWASNQNSNGFYQHLGFQKLYQENILGILFNFYLSPKL